MTILIVSIGHSHGRSLKAAIVLGRAARVRLYAAGKTEADGLLNRLARLRVGDRQAGMKYWLVKSEPSSYSWQNLLADKKTTWTGVRNFQARNNLKAMKKGDRVFFYHSVTEKAVVGIAEVAKEFYPDPTASDGDWVCVDIAPVKALKRPVTLDEIKAEKSMANIPLLTHSRLSVQPLGSAEFEKIISMAENKKPA